MHTTTLSSGEGEERLIGGPQANGKSRRPGPRPVRPTGALATIRVVRYSRVDGVLHQVVDGKAMLISPAGEEVLVLNRTGTTVWEALHEPAALDGLVDAVRAAHPDAPGTAATADVTAFLDELVAAGLVEAARSGP